MKLNFFIAVVCADIPEKYIAIGVILVILTHILINRNYLSDFIQTHHLLSFFPNYYDVKYPYRF